MEKTIIISKEAAPLMFSVPVDPDEEETAVEGGGIESTVLVSKQ